jgi:hypothetical protein
MGKDEEKVSVQRFRGPRLHSRPWTAFGMRIYDKSVSFVRANPKFGKIQPTAENAKITEICY